jgi:hypothetical protein
MSARKHSLSKMRLQSSAAYSRVAYLTFMGFGASKELDLAQMLTEELPLLGCDIVLFAKGSKTFRRNLLHSSSSLRIKTKD